MTYRNGIRAKLHRYERALIKRALVQAGGRVLTAADSLWLSKRTLWNRINAHHIDPRDYHATNGGPSIHGKVGWVVEFSDIRWRGGDRHACDPGKVWATEQEAVQRKEVIRSAHLDHLRELKPDRRWRVVELLV